MFVLSYFVKTICMETQLSIIPIITTTQVPTPFTKKFIISSLMRLFSMVIMGHFFIEQCFQESLEHPNSTSVRNPIFNENHNICVTGRNQESACPGDSGGPLVWIDQFPNLRAYLIGIISGGTPDGRPPTVPTIITLIYNQQIMNWLLQKGGNSVIQCLA